MQWIFGGKFSSKIERPPEQRNIGPRSARDPMGHRASPTLPSNLAKRCKCNWEFRFRISIKLHL